MTWFRAYSEGPFAYASSTPLPAAMVCLPPTSHSLFHSPSHSNCSGVKLTECPLPRSNSCRPDVSGKSSLLVTDGESLTTFCFSSIWTLGALLFSLRKRSGDQFQRYFTGLKTNANRLAGIVPFNALENGKRGVGFSRKQTRIAYDGN